MEKIIELEYVEQRSKKELTKIPIVINKNLQKRRKYNIQIEKH